MWRYTTYDMMFNSRIPCQVLLIFFYSVFSSTIRKGAMASIKTKDSDTNSETSTLSGSIATADFAPRAISKHSSNNNTNFVALQTLLEAPELEQSTSSNNANEVVTESQAVIKKNKRRKIYCIVGLLAFGCSIVLGSIFAVIFGPRPVEQVHSW